MPNALFQCQLLMTAKKTQHANANMVLRFTNWDRYLWNCQNWLTNLRFGNAK